MWTAPQSAVGRRWLRVSLARLDRLPDWAEVRLVKELFVGEHGYAVQVLGPRPLFVKVEPPAHPYRLDLHSCVDGHPLPEPG